MGTHIHTLVISMWGSSLAFEHLVPTDDTLWEVLEVQLCWKKFVTGGSL